MTRVAWRLARNEPVAYLDDLVRVGGVLLAAAARSASCVKVVLDRVADGRRRRCGPLLAAVVGIEAVRWTWLVAHRRAVARLLGRLADGAAGEPAAVARRRPRARGRPAARARPARRSAASATTSRTSAMVLDVWLDLSGAAVSAAVALAVLVAIDPAAAAGRRRARGDRHRRAVVARAPPAGVAARGPRGHGPRDRVHRRHVRRRAGRPVRRAPRRRSAAASPSSTPSGPASAGATRSAPSWSARSATAPVRSRPASRSCVVASHVPPRRPVASATSACSPPTRR